MKKKNIGILFIIMIVFFILFIYFKKSLPGHIKEHLEKVTVTVENVATNKTSSGVFIKTETKIGKEVYEYFYVLTSTDTLGEINKFTTREYVGSTELGIFYIDPAKHLMLLQGKSNPLKPILSNSLYYAELKDEDYYFLRGKTIHLYLTGSEHGKKKIIKNKVSYTHFFYEFSGNLKNDFMGGGIFDKEGKLIGIIKYPNKGTTNSETKSFLMDAEIKRLEKISEQMDTLSKLLELRKRLTK